MPTHNISIPSTSIRNDSKPYTVYRITVSSSLRTNTIEKRYSEFADLHSAITTQAGSAPPVALPSKSWFTRTVSNDRLTEERRAGLEAYVRAIEAADDPRWRHTPAYRAFLEINAGVTSPARGGSAARFAGGGIRDASSWLDSYAELKTQLQEARTWLSRREQAGTVTQQHEAGAEAKKCLIRGSTLVLNLDEALRKLGGDGELGERLGDGEIRRRRDMLGAARKEREGLEGVLNAAAIKTAIASAVAKAAPSGSDSQKLMGDAPKKSSGRRVLGAPLKETERTRELDNEGVLQLQQQIMQEQDDDVLDLTKVVRRMREMGVQINEELILQNEMLGLLDRDVERYVTLLAFETFVIWQFTNYVVGSTTR